MSWQTVHASLTMAKSLWSTLIFLLFCGGELPGAGASPLSQSCSLYYHYRRICKSLSFPSCSFFFTPLLPLRPPLIRPVCTSLMSLLPTHPLYSISLLTWRWQRGLMGGFLIEQPPTCTGSWLKSWYRKKMKEEVRYTLLWSISSACYYAKKGVDVNWPDQLSWCRLEELVIRLAMRG